MSVTSFSLEDAGHIADLLKNEAKKMTSDLGKINIVVGGASGVGKSTLINAMFGKNVAVTGTGKPQTQNITAYSDPSFPVTLYDTKGLEIKNAAETIDDLENLIKSLRNDVDIQKQIHMLWVCILEASNRFEQVHAELLKLAQENNIPAIVILTQTCGNNDFQEEIKKLAAPYKPKAIIPVRAMPTFTELGQLPVKNLDVLVAITADALPDSLAAAFEYAQKADLNRKIAKAKSFINWGCLAAGGAAAIPIPFAHSAAIIPIQAAMVIKMNHALGFDISKDDAKQLVLGIAGILGATVGGQVLFAELIKLVPGAGSLAGAVVGGTVAVTITKMFGHLYLDVISDFVRKGGDIPSADVLISALKTAFSANENYYKSKGKEKEEEAA
jgi:uncharacterized protein (DUF697 family)/GTP-binding protein EngB required for normal cell division